MYQTPLAIAVNNTLAKGIYKGVVIGFTGVIAINVGNSTGTITAALLIDGLTANLTLTTMPVAKSTYSTTFSGILTGNLPALPLR